MVGHQAHPQTTKRIINGLVTCEQSGPLEGVTIAVKGTNIVSGTQQDGIYYIEVPANDSVLTFSLSGYQTTEVKLTAGNEYNVVLAHAQNPPASTPTTIFIDKKGRVVRIHTGYTGPATGSYYKEFVKEFNEEIDSLVKE
jgi:hypothetical protein